MIGPVENTHEFPQAAIELQNISMEASGSPRPKAYESVSW